MGPAAAVLCFPLSLLATSSAETHLTNTMAEEANVPAPEVAEAPYVIGHGMSPWLRSIAPLFFQ